MEHSEKVDNTGIFDFRYGQARYLNGLPRFHSSQEFHAVDRINPRDTVMGEESHLDYGEIRPEF